MKKFYTLIVSTIVCQSIVAQQVDVDYLNPTYTTPNYKFYRFGNSTTYWGGFMWNNDHPDYGNGNDVVIYSYNGRDINIQPSGGNFNILGGNIGIGSTSPEDLLYLDIGNERKGITLTSNGDANAYSDLVFKVTDFSNMQSGIPYQWIISHRKDGYFSDNPGGQPSLEFYGIRKEGGYLAPLSFKSNGDVILASNKGAVTGNVLIGKTNQQNASYRLDVNGKVRADEISVNTTGADFVFAPDYDLPDLKKIEAFIRQNKHLPGIPSAHEMQENGIALGEMNTKLLQKIEELTLYILEQQESIRQLQKEVGELKTDKR